MIEPSPDGQPQPFDFQAHRAAALEAYQGVRPRYEDFAKSLEAILMDATRHHQIRVHSISARAKAPQSFAEKAATPSEADPAAPKYLDPLTQITDLAAARIITYFLGSVNKVCQVVQHEFLILERLDKSEQLIEEERLGYQSVHFIVGLKQNRLALAEYARFDSILAEIQVRTILQHSWAEIEHDIRYKSVATLPADIRRRFLSLAGLLEIADREFQAIEAEHERLLTEAVTSVESGRYERVEITPEALRAYLDRKLGPDLRQSDFSYAFAAKLLRRLGFEDLEEVDEAIRGYDDDAVSRATRGSRQGQVSRFEDTLLAAMGESFLDGHVWQDTDWFPGVVAHAIDRLRSAEIPIRNYRPRSRRKGDSS